MHLLLYVFLTNFNHNNHQNIYLTVEGILIRQQGEYLGDYYHYILPDTQHKKIISSDINIDNLFFQML